MCLLTYFPAGQMPDIQALRNGASTNDDGHGYGLVCDNEVITGHSMDFKEAADEFQAMRSAYPDGPAMFHSRWTTHGTTTVGNCHPFWVPQSPQMIVAHNGILPLASQPVKGDWRSDTRIFAEEILMRKYPVLDSKRTRRKLEAWLGYGNKILILTTDPRYKEQAYLFNERAGDWVGGIWYSNEAYQPRPAYIKVGDSWVRHINGVPAPLTGSGHWWDEWDELDEYSGYRSSIRDEINRAAGAVHYTDSQGRRYYSNGVEGTVLGGTGTYGTYQCRMCKSYDIDDSPTVQVCLHCHSCLICDDSIMDCSCWPGREVAAGDDGQLAVSFSDLEDEVEDAVHSAYMRRGVESVATGWPAAERLAITATPHGEPDDDAQALMERLAESDASRMDG